MREICKRLTLRLNAQEYVHMQRLAQVAGMKMETEISPSDVRPKIFSRHA